MATLFISHSGHDREVVEHICRPLRDVGFVDLFVDFDPEGGIPAGRNWEHELYAQLRKADGIIFVASTVSVASPWCFAEISLARSLGRPVFPVRLQAGVQHPLLSDVQWVDLTRDKGGLDRLRAGLHAAGLDPTSSLAWDPRRSPYPGLAPFAPEDAAVFFGREDETERLVELLQPTLRHGPGRFIAIVGPSGSGKSSLLRAGLLPRLAAAPGRWLVLPPLVPGRRPTRMLARCLAQAFRDVGNNRSAEDIEGSLAHDPSSLMVLADDLAHLGLNGASRRNVLLVIDQTEELIVHSGAREQRAFLHLLKTALNEDSPVWAVATVRSEYLSSAPDRAGLAEVVDDTLLVEPLSRARLGEVIVRPGRRAGLEFATELVERMVEDTAGGDALPLLAYTLRVLCERAGDSSRLSMADYAAVGGVIGAMQGRADRVADELRRRGHGQSVIPTLVQLASITGSDDPTRRRVRRSELSGQELVVVDAFVDASLIVSDHSPTDPAGETTVEVAHEALLRQWSPLREAIEVDRHRLRLRSELERLANDWRQAGYDESYLLRGARLAVFVDWAYGYGTKLGPLERKFLEASRVLSAREVESTLRSNRRLRRFAIALMVLLVIAISVGGLAWQQNGLAQSQARLAWSRQLAAESDRLVDTQPDIAILAGLQSLSLARDQGPTPPAGLIAGLVRVTHASRRLAGHVGQVNGVAFSPDGRLLATTSNDQTVRLWDPATGQPHGQPLRGHRSGVWGVAFSPGGHLLATTSNDGTVQLWDPSTGRPHGPPLTGHTRGVRSVAFSPDSRLIATASDDETVRLWDPSTGRSHGPPLVGHTRGVWGVAFSPDSRLIATTSDDQTVRLWDAATSQPHGPPLTGHTGGVLGVGFSPDGHLLATASGDRTAQMWDPATGQPHGPPLTGHTGGVWGVAFSPDGRLLATTSGDQTVRLWDPATGQPHGPPLVSHTGEVWGVMFSPDGRQLATTSADQTARLWDVSEVHSIGKPLIGHTDWVRGVAFSPDGHLVATTGNDLTVRLWDPATGQPHGPPLAGHTSGVWGVAFSPDGRLLATTSNDQTVRLWDPATGLPHGPPLTGHTSQVNAAAFSPDGRLLATTSDDQTARLWDPATGQPHGPILAGHTSGVWGVAFSPDGRLIATTSNDQTVRLWDSVTGQPHGLPLVGHTGGVWGVAFSPDGRLIATTSNDQTVRLWDSATGQPHGPPLTDHAGKMWGVAFSPDGSQLATTSDDRTVRLWNTAFDDWVDSGCKLTNRNLSMSEWEQLARDLPYERTCPDLPSGPNAPDDAPAAHYSP